jgi:hypothetical protein
MGCDGCEGWVVGEKSVGISDEIGGGRSEEWWVVCRK